MSDFIFGLNQGSGSQPSRAAAAKIEVVAADHDAEFIEVNVVEGSAPGINNGYYQSWFTTENLGAPFNSRRAGEVLDAISDILMDDELDVVLAAARADRDED